VSRRCHALWHTLFLRPDGSVVPCQHLFEEPVGNVRTDDLEGLWNGPALRRTRLSQRAAAFPICRRCCKV
jgi:radical SAM protein with 4Fe4S-binding SPASM domain